MIPGFESTHGVAWLPGLPAVLGEGPVWNARDRCLYWVDADQRKLLRLDPASGGFESTALARAPGSYAFCADGRLLMASRNELALLALSTGGKEVVATPGIDHAVERFNDGACDRRGRFWVGTMDKRMTEPVGSLYRVDPDLGVRRMTSGHAISNGIAFSPDDRWMYHTESRSRRIVRHAFDIDAGTIAHGEPFLELGEAAGNPDGCTIDEEGCLWIAQLGAGCVSRFDPGGRRIASIALPVSRPTSVAFGGENLATLFITTMQHGLTDAQREREPLAGCLFAARPGVRGLPEPEFAR